MNRKRDWLILSQITLMINVAFVLTTFDTPSYELFFIISFVGFLVLKDLTDSRYVNVNWQLRLRKFVFLGTAVFMYIMIRGIIELAPPGLL